MGAVPRQKEVAQRRSDRRSDRGAGYIREAFGRQDLLPGQRREEDGDQGWCPGLESIWGGGAQL